MIPRKERLIKVKRKILAYICAVCIIAVNFAVLSDVAASVPQSATLVEYHEITGAKPGNIFAATDNITFTQNIENKANEAVVSKYSWSITDETGVAVASYSWQDTLGARASITRNIAITNPGKYGIYTISVTEENYKQSTPGNKYTENYSEEFSVCISLGSNNINNSFGFNEKIVNGAKDGVDNQVTVPLMKNAGAKWHRESVMWQGVEPTAKGEYIQLGQYVSRLTEMKAAGIKTVLVLTGRNPLYSWDTQSSEAEAIEAYADFCTYVATECHGVVDHFEIWNEWNHSNFNPANEPPETYAELLKAAYTAIKAVDSDNIVIGCDTAGMSQAALLWIGRVLTALNGGTYMDAISVHCYDYSASNGFPESQFKSEAESLRTLLEAYNLDIPVWLTETGFTTYDNSTAGFVSGCTKDVQLNSLVMLMATNKAYGLFDNVIQYCFYDRGDFSQLESNWGVLNCWKRDNTEKPEAKLMPNGAKPSYLGLAAMNYFIGGNTDFVSLLKDGRSYAFAFYNNNLDKNVILAINGGFGNTVTRTLQLGYTSIDIYDKYGNLTRQMSSQSGEYTIDTYSDPIYIVGNEGSLTEFNEDYTDMSLGVSVDLNTLGVTITGKTQQPDDLVSVMVVTSGAELTAYDPSRIQYLKQTVSDSEGNFSVEYTADSLSGSYQIYANSEKRRSRVVQDVVFLYTVPEISVTKAGTPVTAASQLTAGDRPVIRLTGLNAGAANAPKLIVAQYGSGSLKNVRMIDAAGDYTVIGNEFSTDFTVLDGTDRIKIMYWNMNTLAPLVASYEIN